MFITSAFAQTAAGSAAGGSGAASMLVQVLPLVLIFGGGYDGGQENYSYRTDTMGNGIYMVDAASGA